MALRDPLAAPDGAGVVGAAHQQITLDWWQQRRQTFELVVSEAVVREAERGDQMTQDTIVEEVRRGREEHAAGFNYDLSQIFADLRRTEQERNRKDFPLVEPPERSEVPPNPSLQRTRFARR
jgi:hypothetical protein